MYHILSCLSATASQANISALHSGSASQLCLPSLNNVQMTQGFYSITTQTPLHTSHRSVMTGVLLPVYAGDIRLPELINPVCQNIPSHFFYKSFQQVMFHFLKCIRKETLQVMKHNMISWQNWSFVC